MYELEELTKEQIKELYGNLGIIVTRVFLDTDSKLYTKDDFMFDLRIEIEKVKNKDKDEEWLRSWMAEQQLEINP